jgi:hypothetical protein
MMSCAMISLRVDDGALRDDLGAARARKVGCPHLSSVIAQSAVIEAKRNHQAKRHHP